MPGAAGKYVHTGETGTGYSGGTTSNLGSNTVPAHQGLSHETYISANSTTANPKTKQRLVKLIGRKCLVCCVLKGINGEVPWDTGEQVSILSIDWLQCYLPNTQVLPISALMEGEESLHISTADGDSYMYTCICPGLTKAKMYRLHQMHIKIYKPTKDMCGQCANFTNA